MSLETYTLEVAEDETHEGITADVYGEDGLVEASTRVTYSDHSLVADRDDWEPEPRRTAVDADVLRIDLQVERGDGRFEFRLLGDRDELARERVTDDDWRLDEA